MISTGTLKIAKVVQGDTFVETLTFKDGEDNPIDLNVYDDIIMDVRTTPDNTGDSLFQITTTPSNGSSISITGESDNIMTITVSSEDSNKMDGQLPQMSFLDEKLEELINVPGFNYKQLKSKNINLYFRDIRFVKDGPPKEVYTKLNGAYLVFKNITDIPE